MTRAKMGGKLDVGGHDDLFFFCFPLILGGKLEVGGRDNLFFGGGGGLHLIWGGKYDFFLFWGPKEIFASGSELSLGAPACFVLLL